MPDAHSVYHYVLVPRGFSATSAAAKTAAAGAEGEGGGGGGGGGGRPGSSSGSKDPWLKADQVRKISRTPSLRMTGLH